MAVTKDAIFAAAATGDLALFEEFFAEPMTLETMLATEARLTETELLRRRTRSLFLPVYWGKWMHRWQNARKESDDIFSVAARHHQYELLAWLYTAHIAAVVPQTLQYFLVDIVETAIARNDLALLELMLTSHAWATYPEEARDVFSAKFLRTAVGSGRASAVRLLLAHGADGNAGSHSMEWNAPVEPQLVHAVGLDVSSQVVRVLVDHGAETIGESAVLHRAVETGHAGVVQRLLALGADARTTDSGHASVLHHAAKHGFCDVLTTLLETTCVDMDVANADGEGALNLAMRVYATRCENGDEAAEDERELLSDDATKARQCSSMDEDAWKEGGVEKPTPRVSFLRTIATLVRYGVNVDHSAPSIQNPCGYAPLHWAVRFSSVGLVRLLLRHGANANVLTLDGMETPAHLLWVNELNTDAVLEMLDLLVHFGADLSRKDAFESTPMDNLRDSPFGITWIKRCIDGRWAAKEL